MQDRNNILNSITFLRLAEALDILGEQGVNEALLILIHSNMKYNQKRGTWGEQGKQRSNEPCNPTVLTALMAKTQHSINILHTGRQTTS